jgi:hypothetical protein
MRWVVHIEEMRSTYKILVGKPEGKRLLVRPRHKWEGHVKMDHREIGLEGINWIYLAQDRDQ